MSVYYKNGLYPSDITNVHVMFVHIKKRLVENSFVHIMLISMHNILQLINVS